MARPRKHVEAIEVLRLRLAGFSWPSIARSMRLGLGTVYRAYRTAIATLQPFQNPKASKLRAVASNESDASAALSGSAEFGKGHTQASFTKVAKKFEVHPMNSGKNQSKID